YRPIDELEHLFHHMKKTASTADFEPTLALRRGVDQFVHLVHKLVQNVHVQNAQDDKESGRYGGANDAPDSTECAKFGADGGRCRRDGNRCNDNDAIEASRISDKERERKAENKESKRLTYKR
ncbi:MAG: hypothetical protein Q9214_005084, partial [Letrouitia sp. 1 TL-2023]